MTNTATKCSICQAPSGLYLCNIHISYLDEGLEAIPWLYRQLRITATRQDKLHTVSGKSSDTPSPVNWGASRTADDVSDTLERWVAKLVNESGLSYSDVRDPRRFAPWLRDHINVLAGRPDAKDAYFDVIGLTGNPDRPKEDGRLLLAINRRTKVFAGLCPRVKGYDDEGAPVECGASIHALDGETEAQCPMEHCGETVDVIKNKTRTLMSRDLMPETALLQTMEHIGEPVSHRRFHDWLKQGRIRVHGYQQRNGDISPVQQRGKDPRVFSIRQARQLREMELEQAEVAS